MISVLTSRSRLARTVIMLPVLAAAMASQFPRLVQAHPAKQSSQRTIHVSLTDFRVTLDSKSVQANVPIRLVITNKGIAVHELVMERTRDVDKALDMHGMRYEADNIAPKATRTVVWTFPARGSWKLACHKPDHYKMGMFVIVQAR